MVASVTSMNRIGPGASIGAPFAASFAVAGALFFDAGARGESGRSQPNQANASKIVEIGTGRRLVLKGYAPIPPFSFSFDRASAARFM